MTRVCRITIAAFACALGASRHLAAQATVTVAAGATSNTQAAPGSKLVVPVLVDLSAAAGGNVGRLTTNLAWNAAFLTLDSLTGGALGTITPTVVNATAGQASFSMTSASGTTVTTSVAYLYFTASATPGGTQVQVTPTSMGNSIGALGLSQVLARHLDVCVAPVGVWGDVNVDDAVNIVDAQQIARSVVGLSVLNATAVATHGDVNADGAVNIIDAQQIARYAVALSTPARMNTPLSPAPAVASLAVSRATLTLALGQTASLSATPKDAAGFAETGCAVVTWSSSDATKVRVNASGTITGLAAGSSATITASSGGQTAQTVVTVIAADAVASRLHLRNLTAGGTSGTNSSWLLSGLLSDEWKSSDTFVERNGIDQRAVPDYDAVVRGSLTELYKTRVDARTAIAGLVATAAAAANIGELYLVLGYAEMLLAETFCNGVMLSDASSGLVMLGPPVSNAALYAMARAHFDSALALSGSGVDTLSVAVAYAARVAKARTLVDLGQFAAAATLVTSVPTSFRQLSTLATGESNKIWSLNNSQKRWTVGDSFDVSGVIANAIPFASAADPRVPVTGTSTGTSPAGKGQDGSTNLVTQSLWTTSDAAPLFSGVDARLIEAEAQLNANDLAGMTATLNALRAAPQVLGAVTTPVMSALATPGTPAMGTDLFFREKAFWTFGRGQRLGDLRRLVRLYGRSASTVFPTGVFFKGGNYGTTVNFPVAYDEEGNVLSLVCTDRNP